MTSTTTRPEDGFYVLVTGANSGLGFAIGCRLIDEFLQTRPHSQTLVLIITTRSTRKGDDTIRQLQQHLQNVCRKAEKSITGIRMPLERRVRFQQEILDLNSILSVQRLAKRLRQSIPKLNAVILNAGIGGWEGVNWPSAFYLLLTDWKHAVTWPQFKISGVGWVTKPQIPADAAGNKVEEPPLGEVFCSNVFGHYLLGHYLAPLLAAHEEKEGTTGRLIWLSSLEAYASTFSFDDFQGLQSKQPYEESKRLTDVLALTSHLPATSPLVNQYFNTAKPTGTGATKAKPKMYLTQPGICATSIFPIHFALALLMTLSFYVARWLGSQWHGVTASKGACAPVWVALAEQSVLDTMEEREGKGKWGSATDFWGRERVERTEVEGWGWGGIVGEFSGRKGRWRFAKDLTEQSRQEFEELGKGCWTEIERLREDWETRLVAAGVGEELD
ncbi:3-keto-steroid reductase [Lepidopterella palustris CBS 459.81]|uniref:3-keto-steroid reductase n=1 Tax=Lepidopterella palustris CBS 459.81 TaxID=1314670 RepID=A0A8E2EJ76_9PEZI|nr:3-keto-steroid reductase [Lepidopterella palustris CBS 459.81]